MLKEKYRFGRGAINQSIVLEDHNVRGLDHETIHAQCVLEYRRLKAKMEEEFNAFDLHKFVHVDCVVDYFAKMNLFV